MHLVRVGEIVEFVLRPISALVAAAGVGGLVVAWAMPQTPAASVVWVAALLATGLGLWRTARPARRWGVPSAAAMAAAGMSLAAVAGAGPAMPARSIMTLAAVLSVALAVVLIVAAARRRDSVTTESDAERIS